MAQNYRIYINDNSLFISKELISESKKIQQIDIQNFDFPTFCKKLMQGGKKEYILRTSDPKSMFRTLKKSCTLIRAAGGLVQNKEGALLFIFRNNKWDLPKGKAEAGEKMKESAVREVEEECGIKVDTLGRKLCKTYHVYFMDTRLILKKTSWYLMQVNSIPTLIPQAEEGITSAVWVQKSNLQEQLSNTYPLILDVIQAADLE